MEFEQIANKINIFGEFTNLYWGVALSGEIGEINGLIKEEHNKDIDIKDELKYELADVFICTVLMAKHNNIDLEKAILEKIEMAKEKWEKNQK